MQSNDSVLHTQVIVVGAGPTGLALAAALNLRGIDTLVIDRQAAGANTSRAAVIHARTLEALEDIGVADRLVERGIRASRFTIRDRDRVLVPVHFEHLPTRYPYALMISQAQTEAVLRDRLHELGGEVEWGRSIAHIGQSDQCVHATLDDGRTVHGRYLVGADGMHSAVRQLCGIEFDGGAYDDSFVLADVRLSGALPSDEVILYFSPAGLVVVAPLPGGTHRIVATTESAPQTPDVAYIQALLDARGPERERVLVREVVWGSRFRVHHRLAKSYKQGRVLIAGDAAHVHSPAGGQGMNLGIQDGIELADALTIALNSGDEHVLKEYEAQRRPIAREVVKLADRMTRLATAPRALRPVRNFLLRTIARAPAMRRRLAMRLSGLALSPAAAPSRRAQALPLPPVQSSHSRSPAV
jgi:2-polyprenyl-6-methoxyphenol hydroxylase-like FAD-dependent oxidoreductase